MHAMRRRLHGGSIVHNDPLDGILDWLLGVHPREAQTRAWASEASRIIDAMTERELKLFQAGLTGLEQLERERDEALLQFPFDRELVHNLVTHRAQQLRQAVHDLALHGLSKR